MEQNKAERLNKNITEKMCSSDGNVVGEMCSPADTDTYRDNSCTTSDRFVNWTAASETHQRESNTFIIQQNKRNVKDRSFSREIESERSFFIPLKRILLRRFEGLIRCVRERRYYGSHIKDSEKNLARQVSFC